MEVRMKQIDKVNNYNKNTFEDIKNIDENGNEFWYARELQIALEYTRWENFRKVIDKAIIAFESDGSKKEDWILEVRKPIVTEKGREEFIKDYKLSRYICYLIVQNGDPRKSIIGLGQKYFVIQTRKQELSESEFLNLTEDEKRLYKRDKTKKANYSLQQTASSAGVKDMAKFHNAGYKGLYNGETADDIFKRKLVSVGKNKSGEIDGK